jgi:lysophospholipase L1-like esterase
MKAKKSVTSCEQTPLRLLVVGDSLAAGVGISKRGTPVLPESIAKRLSEETGGRAVQWTCVGTPGASSSQIVQDILNLPHSEPSQVLETKLLEFQATRQRAKQWLERRRQSIREEPPEPEHGINRIQQWWHRVRNDVKSFRQQVLTKQSREEVKQEVQEMMEERRLAMSAEEYDVAVVLTGLNDLKELFLPHMMSGTNSSMSQQARENASPLGITGEFQRLMQTVKNRMRFQLQSDNDTEGDIGKTGFTLGKADIKSNQRGPLIVFPAIPTTVPSPLSKQAPLSWFILPLIEKMDQHKKLLAEKFPHLVLFVESPSRQAIKDLEEGRGPIVASRRAEQVLLTVTDATQRAKEKVEELMKQHYQRWTIDVEDAAKEEQRDVYHGGCHDHLPASKKQSPGSSMVAADNIHPNDDGYDFWGRHIAEAIVAEWIEQEKAAA